MSSGVEFFFIVITSVRVPPLSLRGYEGWATCGQNMLTGSPLESLTIHFSVFVLLSSQASGSLRCPFGVMKDGPHVGKIRSRDPPWYP